MRVGRRVDIEDIVNGKTDFMLLKSKTRLSRGRRRPRLSTGCDKPAIN
jgi:hypothetical protein